MIYSMRNLTFLLTAMPWYLLLPWIFRWYNTYINYMIQSFGKETRPFFIWYRDQAVRKPTASLSVKMKNITCMIHLWDWIINWCFRMIFSRFWPIAKYALKLTPCFSSSSSFNSKIVDDLLKIGRCELSKSCQYGGKAIIFLSVLLSFI